MRVNHHTPGNHVRMRAETIPADRKPLHRRRMHARQIQYAQQDQHAGHRQFHGQAERRRDRQFEQDDCGADDENGDRVPQSPQSADDRRVHTSSARG